jgi:hypothetical protein
MLAIRANSEGGVMQAIFGLIGVLVGACLTLIQNIWLEWRARGRHAHYLAICVVIALDKYIEDCADVAMDDGLSQGQTNEKGHHEIQVSSPPAPTFAPDLDWKSIDHKLAYRLLSLPNYAQAADRIIGFAWENAFPPDFDELFEERQYQYAKLGLAAFALAQELRREYDISAQSFGD